MYRSQTTVYCTYLFWFVWNVIVFSEFLFFFRIFYSIFGFVILFSEWSLCFIIFYFVFWFVILILNLLFCFAFLGHRTLCLHWVINLYNTKLLTKGLLPVALTELFYIQDPEVQQNYALGPLINTTVNFELLLVKWLRLHYCEYPRLAYIMTWFVN